MSPKRRVDEHRLHLSGAGASMHSKCNSNYEGSRKAWDLMVGVPRFHTRPVCVWCLLYSARCVRRVAHGPGLHLHTTRCTYRSRMSVGGPRHRDTSLTLIQRKNLRVDMSYSLRVSKRLPSYVQQQSRTRAAETSGGTTTAVVFCRQQWDREQI